jgi:hypothetical protein
LYLRPEYCSGKGRISAKTTTMKSDQFNATLTDDLPLAGITLSLAALWYAGKGDWEQAHAIAQDIPIPEGSWVHAWLHRQEGDAWNANYWYQRAGKTMPEVSLEEEWRQMVKTLLRES